MRTLYTLVAVGGLALGINSNASAVELVKNGGLETGPQYNADFWIKPDLGFNPNDGEPNNYARVGNWVNQAGIDEFGYAFGPHPAGQGTGTQIPTRTAWLGGLSPRTGIVYQDIDTAGFAGPNWNSTLKFKVVYEDEDVAGRDFFYVDFGTTRVMTIDMGAYYHDFGQSHREGGIHFWVLETPSIDLTPYMDGTTKRLTFTTINDAAGGSSSAWVDNVSIQAVPEPATMAALGFGALALLRRRRRA